MKEYIREKLGLPKYSTIILSIFRFTQEKNPLAVGRVPEIVKGTAAERFLCNPGDVECFIQRLEAITASTPSDIAEMGLKTRRLLLNKFSGELLREKIVRIFYG